MVKIFKNTSSKKHLRKTVSKNRFEKRLRRTRRALPKQHGGMEYKILLMIVFAFTIAIAQGYTFKNSRIFTPLKNSNLQLYKNTNISNDSHIVDTGSIRGPPRNPKEFLSMVVDDRERPKNIPVDDFIEKVKEHWNILEQVLKASEKEQFYKDLENFIPPNYNLNFDNLIKDTETIFNPIVMQKVIETRENGNLVYPDIQKLVKTIAYN